MSSGRARPHRAARGPRERVAPLAASEGPEADVEIQSIAAGGDGVARADGRVVFVPRTAPGDRVRIRLTAGPGARFARGRVVEMLRPSAARVTPLCVHYDRDRCGGCQLQHLPYDAQLRAKGAIVRDALDRIGRRGVSDVPVSASPEPWRYRRKLTLALRRQPSGGWTAGLHRFDAPDEIFPLEMCPITTDAVLDVWRAVLHAGAWLPDAPALRAAVRETADGYALVVEGGAAWEGSEALQQAVPALTEIWWVPDGQARRPMDGGSPLLGGRAQSANGASFVQVNAPVSDALHDAVVRRAMAFHPHSAVDAYAGTGATAVALARSGVRVVAIESDRDAAARCRGALPAGSRVEVALVEDALPRALPADVVVLNPPRHGLMAPVTTLLEVATPRPRAIVYVSCDPATLARDLARLPSWRLAWVSSFDMFPQTAHVETVCELVPAEAAP